MSPSRKYRSLDQHAALVIDVIKRYLDGGEVIVASSSFQTQSMPLLHMISKSGDVPVYFIDTGFHFAETLSFRDKVATQLELRVMTISSDVTKISQLSPGGEFLYTSNPDDCCHINKIIPMEVILAASDIWISGVRKDQSDHRLTLRSRMPGPHGTTKYYPMLEWTGDMVRAYNEQHHLPEHPLEREGYPSVGCAPCTQRLSTAELSLGRHGRWLGMSKTECGLHTGFIE